MSMLSRMREKSADFICTLGHGKFVEGSLAFAMVLTFMFGAAACGGAENNNAGSDPNHSITDPSGDFNNPSADPDGNASTGQYSEILQNVLKNQSYYDAISKTKDQFGRIWTSYQIVQAIPYNFLAKQGHDVVAYKNDELDCESAAFIKGDDTNTLYVSVKAENEYAGGNYYTNYILSYPLTHQEYSELYMLHDERYVQAPLFIQELDNEKIAKVESQTNIDTESFKKLTTSIQTWDNIIMNMFYSSTVCIDLTKVTDANHISLNIRDRRDRHYGSKMVNEGKIRNIDLEIDELGRPSLYNDILKITDAEKIKQLNKEEYKNNYIPITYFISNDIINVQDLSK